MSNTTVDAYWIDLDAHSRQSDDWLSKLDREDRLQAQRFRVERERSRFVIRRAWLRALLSQRLALSPEDIHLSKNAFGKPFLPARELRFNLSKRAGIALCVIAEGLDLGCDVEQINPELASIAIADRFFSSSEKLCLSQLPQDEWLQGFFNCWTRKEAYIKARGVGMSCQLDSFDVSLAPNDAAELLRGCAGWSVQSFEPIRGFIAAVVAPGDDWILKFDHRPIGAGGIDLGLSLKNEDA